MIVFLEKWLGVSSSHPDFRFRAFLSFALLFVGISFSFFVIYNWLIDYYFPMLIANLIGIVICFISGYLLLVKKKAQASAILLQCIVSVGTFFLILVDGNEEFALVFALLVPVLGVFLLGYRLGSWLSLVYFLGVFYFCYTNMDSWEPAPFLPISLIHFSFIYLMLFMVSFFYDTSRLKAYQMMEEANRQLQELATTDALTQLRNRRYMEDILLNTGRSHYIAILDLDDFKKVNDEFGHGQGDKVLVQLAQVLMNNVGPVDTVGRWGGEEFMIIFAQTEQNQVEKNLQRLNDTIASTDFGIDRQVTISIGLALHQADQHRDCMLAADKALYVAKSDGKNTYRVA